MLGRAHSTRPMGGQLPDPSTNLDLEPERQFSKATRSGNAERSHEAMHAVGSVYVIEFKPPRLFLPSFTALDC